MLGNSCNVEAECHFCYLRGSSVYVHESCCLGVQRHPPTYESRSGFQDGPETNMKQMWCLFYVTSSLCVASSSLYALWDALPRTNLPAAFFGKVRLGGLILTLQF